MYYWGQIKLISFFLSKEKKKDISIPEFYISQNLTTAQSVDLFKNDKLFFKPGTQFRYTSHGYTLLSRAMEKATGRSMSYLFKNYFAVNEMFNTHVDDPKATMPPRYGYTVPPIYIAAFIYLLCPHIYRYTVQGSI